jgi:hypothetical protein
LPTAAKKTKNTLLRLAKSKNDLTAARETGNITLLWHGKQKNHPISRERHNRRGGTGHRQLAVLPGVLLLELCLEVLLRGARLSLRHTSVSTLPHMRTLRLSLRSMNKNEMTHTAA